MCLALPRASRPHSPSSFYGVVLTTWTSFHSIKLSPSCSKQHNFIHTAGFFSTHVLWKSSSSNSHWNEWLFFYLYTHTHQKQETDIDSPQKNNAIMAAIRLQRGHKLLNRCLSSLWASLQWRQFSNVLLRSCLRGRQVIFYCCFLHTHVGLLKLQMQIK